METSEKEMRLLDPVMVLYGLMNMWHSNCAGYTDPNPYFQFIVKTICSITTSNILRRFKFRLPIPRFYGSYFIRFVYIHLNPDRHLLMV